jgi:hypothetical protein
MKQRITGIVLSFIAGLVPLAAQAAAPGSTITASGVPAKWDTTRSIVYNIDQGPLGKLSNSKAARVVLAAFEAWQKVDTAKLEFEESDPLDRDVTGANYDDFIAGLPSDVNPIIFDNDGTIMQGLGLSGAAVGAIFQSTPTGKIAQGILFIDGRVMDGLHNPEDISEADLTRAVTRAVGQMLGLGSSDLNDELIFDGDVANNTAVPIMYPGLILGGGSTPTLDDRMAISALYPATSFEANTGVIRGQITLADGVTGLQGIAVIARKVDDPINSAVEAISGVTFVNTTRRGSRDPAVRGAFEIRVPPGNYSVEYRPLKAAIGPKGDITPLPGGAQYYQTAPSSTAGPDVASATPVTVSAGQATELKLVAGGVAAPAVQNITEAEPNDSALEAPLLPDNGVITGKLSVQDSSQVTVAWSDGPDRLEDVYRIVVKERSILTLHLLPVEKVDVDLHVFNRPLLSGLVNVGTVNSAIGGTDAETLQVVAGPGTYYIGVSEYDVAQNAPPATDYTLSINISPVGVLPDLALPVLNQLVIGEITANSAEAHWITDLDTTADAVIGQPQRQVGDAAPAKTHRLALTGLTEEAFSTLVAISQLPGAGRDNLPTSYFRTANKTAVEGAPNLNAAMIGQLEDVISINGEATATRLVSLGIRNSGGNAANVQLTGLTVSPGWKLAIPVTEPITVGRLDSGGTAIVVVRLLRDGPATGEAPAANVTGTGTLAGADGAALNFNIGP